MGGISVHPRRLRGDAKPALPRDPGTCRECIPGGSPTDDRSPPTAKRRETWKRPSCSETERLPNTRHPRKGCQPNRGEQGREIGGVPRARRTRAKQGVTGRRTDGRREGTREGYVEWGRRTFPRWRGRTTGQRPDREREPGIEDTGEVEREDTRRPESRRSAREPPEGSGEAGRKTTSTRRRPKSK